LILNGWHRGAGGLRVEAAALVVGAGGFVAGLLTEQFRVKLWVRQERWKLKHELYSKLLSSLDQAGLGLLELMEAIDKGNLT